MKLKFDNQEDLVRWIPVILPMLAVMLAVGIFIIDMAVLTPAAG